MNPLFIFVAGVAVYGAIFGPSNIGGPPGALKGPVQPAKGSGGSSLLLLSTGPSEARIADVLVRGLGMRLEEAAHCLRNAPVEVAVDYDHTALEGLAAKLESLGAEVEIR